MTYAAVVAGVLAEHGHTDVEPLVLADLMGAARYGTTADEVQAMCSRHGFTGDQLPRQIVHAVEEAAR